MAKSKEKINKSQMVREILAANPAMKAKEVVATMAEKGQSITDALVYFIKGKSSAKKARKKRVVTAAAHGSAVLSDAIAAKADPLTMIREVKALAQKAGGYPKLKQLVDALAD